MGLAIATTSVASEDSPIRLARNVPHPDATTAVEPATVATTGRGRVVLGWLEDSALLLLLVIAFPVVILSVGTPVALVVQLLIQIGRRLW